MTEELTDKLDTDLAMLRKAFNDRIVFVFASFPCVTRPLTRNQLLPATSGDLRYCGRSSVGWFCRGCHGID